MKVEIVTTRSGARAIRDLDVGQLMHPVVGPLVESQRLYVEPSKLTTRPHATLFDVGLGAGSNAVAALNAGHALTIVSFDRSLDALALALTQPADFGLEGRAGQAARAILARGHYADDQLTWRYVAGELPDTLDVPERADIVFWDAYPPPTNPTLWTYAAFRLLRRRCNAGATLHTYCGATSIRAALLLADFYVGLGARIGEEKRATMAAIDRADLEEPLDARWLERVKRSSAPFPSDAPADAISRLAAKLDAAPA